MNQGSVWKRAISQGFSAAKKNIMPGLFLAIFGILIVGGYYTLPAVTGFLDRIAELKKETGFVFSAISTAIFGGLIPSIVPRLLNRHPSKLFLISNTIFWAFKGLEIDLLYRIQDSIFGSELNAQTIVAKSIVDQLIYAPFVGLLNVVLFYRLRDCNYSFSKFKATLVPHWYREQVLPLVISNWIVWLPAALLIYCLPLSLQLPVQNLVLCFWVLLLALLTRPQDDDDSSRVEHRT